MSDLNQINDITSSITETSDVFIKHVVQSGGMFPFDIFPDTLTIVLGLTVLFTCCTLICIIHNKNMCR